MKSSRTLQHAPGDLELGSPPPTCSLPPFLPTSATAARDPVGLAPGAELGAVPRHPWVSALPSSASPSHSGELQTRNARAGRERNCRRKEKLVPCSLHEGFQVFTCHGVLQVRGPPWTRARSCFLATLTTWRLPPRATDLGTARWRRELPRH